MTCVAGFSTTEKLINSKKEIFPCFGIKYLLFKLYHEF